MFPYFRVFLVDLLLSTFLKVVGSDKPKAGLWLPGRQLLPIPWITHLRATASITNAGSRFLSRQDNLGDFSYAKNVNGEGPQEVFVSREAFRDANKRYWKGLRFRHSKSRLLTSRVRPNLI